VSEEEAIELQEVISSTHPRLPVIVHKLDNNEWVCMLTGAMLYFFWDAQDWYD
jgi:hypothetical protein